MILVVALVAAGCGGSGQPPPRGLGLQLIGKFDDPVYVTQPPDGGGTLYVVERAGRVRAVAPDGGSGPEALPGHPSPALHHRRGWTTVAGLRARLRAQRPRLRGLRRPRRPRTRGPDRRPPGEGLADPGSLMISTIPHPNFVHWSGLLRPRAGLTTCTSESATGGPTTRSRRPRRSKGACSARSCGSTRVRGTKAAGQCLGGRPYTVPRTNPYVGRRGRDEVYALGLRNPWRYSFDREDRRPLDRGRRRLHTGGDRPRRAPAPRPAPTSAGPTWRGPRRRRAT